MKYTTLLFDLDDTLLDFGKAEDNAINKLLIKYNIPVTEENKQLYVKMNKAKWTALEKGEITRKQLFATRFSDYFSALGVEADGIKANEEYILFLGQGHFLIDGALDVCRELNKKYSMYIITNGAKKAQEGRLTDSPLMEFFDGVFISEEIGFDKPKKEYFDFVYKNITEQDKSKTLVIGDSLNSDIAGAVNYGVDSCWVNRGEPKETAATYTVKNIGELLSIL
ncbi:MAG: YjjG family noncanonical pyrimidine nucleotidase [Clostridia bacterium]|nr:YjjG family noncanonical pyrimidine nucleotidase [Clostridia bacterium]